ncbi:MAG: LysR family transcriptional regulator [Myxococcota bacterium]
MAQYGNLNHVAAFVAVVAEGSFSGAARRLRISKSAASEHVRKLEDALGVRVIERNNRQIRLTQAGQQFHPFALEMLGSWEAGCTVARTLQGSPRGELRLTAPVCLGSEIIAPIVVRFAERYPEVIVDLRVTDHVLSFATEPVDVAIRPGPLADSALISRRVGTGRLVLVGTPGLLERWGPIRTPEPLDKWPAVIHSGLSAGWELFGPDDAHPVRVHPRVAARATNEVGVRALLLAGAGFALVPEYTVVGALATGAVVECLPGWSGERFSIYALYAPQRPTPPRISLFIDMLADQFPGGS